MALLGHFLQKDEGLDTILKHHFVGLQDSDPRGVNDKRGQMKKTVISRLLRKGLIVFLLVIAIPLEAQASLISFVSEIFSKDANAAADVSADKNSQTMPLLQAAVNSDPNAARGGGDITIVGGSALLPETGPSGSIADIVEEEHASTEISLYVVRKGDTLSKIAELFGVSVNTIMWANDLRSGGALREGETLIILPVSGIRYTIKKGDTLKSLAAKYKADIDEIVQYNDLDADTSLAVGQVITIPDAEIAAVPVASKSSAVVTSKPRAASGPEYVGYYMRPVANAVKSQGLHGYNGVDLAASTGTQVVASAGGTVIVSKVGGWNGGYGNYIVIAHPNGTQTLYSHLSRNVVSVGARVEQGQHIGNVGNTGKSTGPHLHFEIRGAKNPF
jgi:murein DD-endopeptidase MepM/ murein hydrolase activator NlpD